MQGKASALRRFLRLEGGATAIEYGLIAGIIGATVIAIAGTGGSLEALYDKLRAIVTALGG